MTASTRMMFGRKPAGREPRLRNVMDRSLLLSMPRNNHNVGGVPLAFGLSAGPIPPTSRLEAGVVFWIRFGCLVLK